MFNIDLKSEHNSVDVVHIQLTDLCRDDIRRRWQTLWIYDALLSWRGIRRTQGPYRSVCYPAVTGNTSDSVFPFARSTERVERWRILRCKCGNTGCFLLYSIYGWALQNYERCQLLNILISRWALLRIIWSLTRRNSSSNACNYLHKSKNSNSNRWWKQMNRRLNQKAMDLTWTPAMWEHHLISGPEWGKLAVWVPYKWREI